MSLSVSFFMWTRKRMNFMAVRCAPTNRSFLNVLLITCELSNQNGGTLLTFNQRSLWPNPHSCCCSILYSEIEENDYLFFLTSWHQIMDPATRRKKEMEMLKFLFTFSLLSVKESLWSCNQTYNHCINYNLLLFGVTPWVILGTPLWDVWKMEKRCETN